MSVRDMNRKIIVKGDLEPSPSASFKYNEKIVSCTLPLWQVNILDAIQENLENDHRLSDLGIVYERLSSFI